jgi:hypothetical protein
VFGLFPEFSTPVEKTVENRRNRRFITVLGRFSAVRAAAMPENAVNMGLCGHSWRVELRNEMPSLGEDRPKTFC